jgi:hypothetical protein
VKLVIVERVIINIWYSTLQVTWDKVCDIFNDAVSNFYSVEYFTDSELRLPITVAVPSKA